MSSETSIEPDTKDWTWVLERPCPECGFQPDEVGTADLAAVVRANARTWEGVLAGPDAKPRLGLVGRGESMARHQGARQRHQGGPSRQSRNHRSP